MENVMAATSINRNCLPFQIIWVHI